MCLCVYDIHILPHSSLHFYQPFNQFAFNRSCDSNEFCFVSQFVEYELRESQLRICDYSFHNLGLNLINRMYVFYFWHSNTNIYAHSSLTCIRNAQITYRNHVQKLVFAHRKKNRNRIPRNTERPVVSCLNCQKKNDNKTINRLTYVIVEYAHFHDDTYITNIHSAIKKTH